MEASLLSLRERRIRGGGEGLVGGSASGLDSALHTGDGVAKPHVPCLCTVWSGDGVRVTGRALPVARVCVVLSRAWAAAVRGPGPRCEPPGGLDGTWRLPC